MKFMGRVALALTGIWIAGCGGGSSESFECKDPGQEITYTLPDDSPETYAGLEIVHEGNDCAGKSLLVRLDVPPMRDGSVTVRCPDTKLCAHETIVFVLK